MGSLPDDQRRDSTASRSTLVEGVTLMARKRTVGVVLYEGFELLDACGPIEMLGNLPDQLRVVMVAQHAGPVRSTQGPAVVADWDFSDCPPLDVLLVPGGLGSRTEANNPEMLQWLSERAADAEITASLLLAAAGLLDGRRATTNKRSFEFVAQTRPAVEWVREARWVDDGDMVSSSGVSAGMDMALHLIRRLVGNEASDQIAEATEYEWHRDASWDPFAARAGLLDR